jgi:hypothetical protein
VIQSYLVVELQELRDHLQQQAASTNPFAAFISTPGSAVDPEDTIL